MRACGLCGLMVVFDNGSYPFHNTKIGPGWYEWCKSGRRIVVTHDLSELNRTARVRAKDQDMSISPLANNVVVKPTPRKTMTAGGIHLPDVGEEKTRPERGAVLAVGPGRLRDDGTREAIDLKPGQLVIFQKYGGTDIEIDDVKMKILAAEDILAVIDGEAAD